ncbi:MAG: MBL fold metallo-hydrolase [Actinomycetia bacterium]|nr:MBL fold metallo-hydrolase [Actinomycetes bacterium]
MTYTSAPHVLVIETPGLGNRGYIAHDGQYAVVVDPQRDIDRVEHLLADHGLEVTHVVETHVHNDYVTGGLELARRHGAAYLVPADAQVPFEHTPVRDGEMFTVGGLVLAVLATPGHTPHHVAYSVQRSGVPGVHQGAIFTGGSMLYGAVGRPDLVGPELTEGLAHEQWHSVQRLADEFADDTQVFPTHGFGSFCAATQNEGAAGTVADERSNNPALTSDEWTFVEETLAGLDVFPAYYAHVGPANAAGPVPVDLSLPSPADPAELLERIERGEWVIDLRSRELFAAGHLRGSLSFDLDGPFIAYVGWLIPWGSPVTLLGETTEQVHAAHRELVRIGIDCPVAQSVGGPDFWTDDATALTTTERVDFGDLAAIVAERPDTYVLDVRQHLEWEESHIVGAHHMPFYQVPDRFADIPADRPVYVSCGSGYRAAAVISLLRSAVFSSHDSFENLVHVDDDWANAPRTSLPTVRGLTPERQVGWTWVESRGTARKFAADPGGDLTMGPANPVIA